MRFNSSTNHVLDSDAGVLRLISIGQNYYLLLDNEVQAKLSRYSRLYLK